jgi:uncharacterized RDD family membrane protein YckC
MSSPGLWRRLAAIFYDSLLLLSVLFVATIPLVFVPDSLRGSSGVRLAVQAYLLVVSYLFFAGFWTHGGQTLGMRAWRLRLVSSDSGQGVSWTQALRRFLAAILSWACAGLGFLWVLVRPDRRAWHDLLSGSQLVLLPKRK